MGIAAGMFLAAAFLTLSSHVFAEPDPGAVRGENPATPTPPPAGVPEEPIGHGLRWKNAAVKIQRGTDTVLEYLEIPWTAALTYRRL